VIRHGHYIDCYGKRWDQSKAREALGLPEDKRILLFLGTLRRYKGLIGFVEAFSMLKYGDLLLAIAGKVADPDHLDEVRPLMEAEGDRIRLFPGFIPDEQVSCFIGAADFVVLPYDEIHMSGALILALSYGCPVIAPDRGLIREYLPPGTGILFDPQVPSGLVHALEQALTCDGAAMGARGKSFARRLGWEGIARKHARFYARLTGKTGGLVDRRKDISRKRDTRKGVVSR
jgi:glycosyltransferase involved in cell wall biosynthesis